jgi:Spherulation-specific family 4
LTLAGKWRAAALGVALIAFVAIFATAMTQQGPRPKTVAGQLIGVPAYFPPTSSGPGSCSGSGDNRTCTSEWAQLLDNDNANLGFAIANVDTGPRRAAQPSADEASYATTIRKLTRAADPIRVLGYVATGYLGSTGLTTRSGSAALPNWINQAEHDIDDWYRYYGSAGLGGIFLDQGGGIYTDGKVYCGAGGSNADTTYSSAYAQLNQYIKQHHPGAFVVLNPGEPVPRCYENSADTIVTFEGLASTYLSQVDTGGAMRYPWQLDWAPSSPKQIMHIIYGAASEAQLDEVISLSKGNAGFLYVTDDASTTNPYNAIPGDFSKDPSTGTVPWYGYLNHELDDAAS